MISNWDGKGWVHTWMGRVGLVSVLKLDGWYQFGNLEFGKF